MRKIKSFRLIGFIIALAIIFSSLSVFGSTVAFAAEDSTSYSGEEFVESKEFSNAANGETLQSAFSNKTVRECEYVYTASSQQLCISACIVSSKMFLALSFEKAPPKML